MSEPESKAQPEQTLEFRQVRLDGFRSVYADGAWGSVNGRANIALAFFNERPPLPTVVKYAIDSNGQFIPVQTPEEPVIPPYVLRQFEVEVIMTLEVAKNVQQVLGNFIKMAEDAEKVK